MRGHHVVPAALALLLAVASGPGVAATRLEPPAQARGAFEVAVADDGIADLASSLDYDIERIHRYVTDEIRYEPYAGILRGPAGTLGSGAGNSVDQALLLAALLGESAVRYRFARGPLDEVTAATLIDSITVDRDEARRIDQRNLTPSLDSVGDTSTANSGPERGPLLDHYRRDLDEAMTVAGSRLDRATGQLADDVTMITSALAEAGVELPTEPASLPPTELAEHTWVQVTFGADWLDLDPTLPDAEPGSTLTTPMETLEELPDDLRHRVDFEVLLERVAGDGLETDTVLTYSAFADQLSGVPLTFGHITPSGAERLGVAISSVFGEGELDYRPFLDTGTGGVMADEPVAFDLASSTGGGGLLDSELFDDPTPAVDDTTPTASATTVADGEATAEWLIVRLSRPGKEPVVSRRTVFDRIPSAVRHGGEPGVEVVEPVNLVDLSGSGQADYPPMLGLRSFAVATDTTSALSLLSRLRDDEPEGLDLFALTFHGLRDALNTSMALDQDARTFIDGPNVVSYSLDVDAVDESPSVTVGLDIWHRNHGVLPLQGSPRTAAEARVVAGVTSHIAERVAFDGLADAADGKARASGVGALFEAAEADGIPLRVLRDQTPGDLPYEAGATALLTEAIDAGDIVIIPAEAVVVGDRERVGWWRVDPATGATMDVLDDGSGGSTTEYLIPMPNAMRWGVCAFSLVSAIAGVLGPVLLAIGMADAGMAVLLAVIAAIGSSTLGAAAGFACSAKKPPFRFPPAPPRPPGPPPAPFPPMPPGWKPPGALPAPPLPRGPTGTLPNIPGWGHF